MQFLQKLSLQNLIFAVFNIVPKHWFYSNIVMTEYKSMPWDTSSSKGIENASDTSMHNSIVLLIAILE